MSIKLNNAVILSGPIGFPKSSIIPNRSPISGPEPTSASSIVLPESGTSSTNSSSSAAVESMPASSSPLRNNSLSNTNLLRRLNIVLLNLKITTSTPTKANTYKRTGKALIISPFPSPLIHPRKIIPIVIIIVIPFNNPRIHNSR